MLKSLFEKLFTKRNIIITSIILAVIIVLIIVIFKKESSDDFSLVENDLVKEEVKENSNIKVDIKGAIINPGVYELEDNATVLDAINKSGGLLETADTSTINLSKRVFDEMVIIIYTQAEINEMRKGTTTVKYIEKECICPKLENNACIEDKITNADQDDNTSSGKISLNKASLKELMTLTGIGEAKAQDIIDYRNKNGPFTKIEDITKVSGIGSKTFEKIKDQLTL